MDSTSGQRHGLLSGQEMVRHHTECYEVQAHFNRLVSLAEFDETRQADLERMKDQFRRLLSQERVNKSDSISEGVWESDHRRIRITKVEGKWQSFGYEDATGKYVECHEALFLMEMNRLMVKWNHVVVSIEQGYSLFLGHPETLTLEEYQVYSILVRASYYVLRYDSSRKYCTAKSDLLSTEEQCVWKNLFEMLNQSNPRESGSIAKENPKLYESVRRSMRKYCNMIRKSSSSSSNHASTCDDDMAQSKGEPANKRQKLENTATSRENDGFKRIEQFRRMFSRFDIVHSFIEEGLSDAVEPETDSSLRLVFDLFATESQTFKKSFPPLPIARIIVRRSSQPMPHFTDLQRLFRQQKTPVPLMLMLVSESLSVHCFLYDIRKVPRNIIALPDENLTR
ncbi:tRNA-splicing endonuclease subunit Sen54 [Anopheles maculipalpis]|uniref:tRNA-splicing endonuclease subunit Sen54 n=1 Tax=Anopheles maculipalpis TaxID=1496333 RepID=UPI002158D5B4|nr:tRNA-splicing endonuclease subunit Sen54 [Anopheles maculipalpis]